MIVQETQSRRRDRERYTAIPPRSSCRQDHKTQSKKHSTRKTIGCFAETIGCLYQFTNIKNEFKELRDRENAHRDLYWFTLNLKLHPVF